MRYRFIDRILSIDWNKEITISKATTVSEDFYAEHFDGFPVLPGALQIEAMAQACGALIEICSQYQVFSILLMVEKMKFRKLIHPGDQMIIHAAVLSETEEAVQFNTRVLVGDQLMTSGTLLTGKINMKEDQGNYAETFANLEKYYRFPLRDTIFHHKPLDLG